MINHREMTAENLQIASDIVNELTLAQIAKKHGLNQRTILRRKEWPEMQEQVKRIKKKQDAVLQNMAPESFSEALHQVAEQSGVAQAIEEQTREAIRELGLDLAPITKLAILKRLWDLANLQPCDTKGDITGQQRALDSLWDKQGFDATITREAVQATGPDVYVAEWMKTKQ